MIILAASFILAYLSMKNYQEILPVQASGLYLIRNTAAINESFTNKLHEELIKSGSLVSIERLFKGLQEALVIFGPKQILLKFPDLNLLELEDYTAIRSDSVSLWEMAISDKEGVKLPPLNADEQFWLQMILQAQNKDNFKIYVRSAAICPDERRRTKLASLLKEGVGRFVFVPRPVSSEKMLNLYKNRALPHFYSSSSKIGVSSFFKLTEKF